MDQDDSDKPRACLGQYIQGVYRFNRRNFQEISGDSRRDFKKNPGHVCIESGRDANP